MLFLGKNEPSQIEEIKKMIKIKKGVKILTDDFWYDLTKGGYIKAIEICENIKDAKKIEEAIKIIEDFENSCEEQIEGFLQ